MKPYRVSNPAGKSSELEKPKLLIIAGPNGSGKTTFTKLLVGHHWSDDCIFINPDDIAQEVFGDWNSPDATIQAMNRAAEIRAECLAQRKSMLLETVLSSEEKIVFIKEAKDNGFFIRIFFVGTDSPEINAARIARRVMNGGHDVPITKIIKRYYNSMKMCVEASRWADRLYVSDNSIEGDSPELLFRTRDGSVSKEYSSLQKHGWAQKLFEKIPK